MTNDLVRTSGKTPLPASPRSRRAVLTQSLNAIFALAAPALLLSTNAAFAEAGIQNNWRYCTKCHGMFFDGYPKKNTCPKDRGDHTAAGYNFRIDHDTAKKAAAQRQFDWRFCNKCQVMFFNGYPTKGRCAAGGAHVAQGYMFGLNFKPPGGWQQNKWRFCNKCMALFYDGYPDKGACGAGGAHVGQGYEFYVSYETPTTTTPPPVKPPTEAPKTSSLRDEILRIARLKLDQKVGDGECGTLLVAVLKEAKAKDGVFPSNGDYDWGDQINFPTQPALPGDLIQMVNLKLELKTPTRTGEWFTDSQHSAIIEAVNGMKLSLIQQNDGGKKFVTRGEIDLSWTKVRGSYKIYRAVPA